MIGILLLILHIIVFVSIGFVLGAVFEWQNTKWNILHSNKKRKIFYILGMVIGFVLMFGDELIGEIQMKNICNSSSGRSDRTCSNESMRGFGMEQS